MRMFAEESWNVLPNAEPMEEFAARVRRGVLDIVEAMAPNTTVVSFSHAGTIAELCRQATGSRPFAFVAPENTSISRLIVGPDGRWKLRSFNDVAHLGYL
jgi:probable phosphoglycerate mutase